MRRLRLLAVVVGFVAIVCLPSAQAPTAEFDVARIERATVLVMQTRIVDGVAQISCVSSGTIVSSDGLILTNAHGTLSNANCPGDSLIVSLSVRSGEPPVPSFRATVAQTDAGLDIALLRVNAEVNGQPVLPENLSLPFVELADSDSVRLDDTVFVVGYPGIGDDVVTTLQATVQGFNAEPRGGERSWLKVRGVGNDSDIPGTMSGGGAYNRAGLLIGIPATSPLARTVDSANCIQIQDTNRDSLINSSDACVPLGGSINALRPSNFGQVLLRSAQLGLAVKKPDGFASQSGLPPQVSRLFFAPSVNNGMPTTVLSSLPAGSSSVFLFFDYANMTPETVYELRVTVNGSTSPVFSLPPVRWSGGESGLWYIGLVGQPLPNGELLFALLIDGQLATEPRAIRVGGAAEPIPMFRSVAFLLTDGDQQTFGNGYILGVGSTVTAQFTYDNMRDGLEWTGIWYFNGVELEPRVGGIWQTGSSNGSQSTSFNVPSGLLPGRYRLELYIAGTLSALADFTVAGARQDIRPRVFSNARFTVASNDQEALVSRRIVSVTNAVQNIYAVFDWETLAPGTLWQMKWSVDDRVFFDSVTPWALAENGQNYITKLSAPTAIPDGRYKLELLMNGILLQSLEVEIGIGQLPLDLFQDSEGVLLQGRVIDSDSRLGVPDVTIIILSEEYSVVDFTGLAEQVYTSTVTDRNGRFQFSQLLSFGVPYSLIITADGYLPVTTDGVEVDETTENPLERDIYLIRG